MSCAAIPVQFGIPLDEGHLDAMDAREREFWMDLLEQADREIKTAQDRGENLPYVPSESLRAKYQRALTQYSGSFYCQVRQMQQIFLL